ncbi:hypothetical protein CSUI_005375, partial [Cystoisospora suis]
GLPQYARRLRLKERWVKEDRCRLICRLRCLRCEPHHFRGDPYTADSS